MTDPSVDERSVGHPGDEEVADYLNGKLPSAGIEAFEFHLAECRDCRRQVTSARRVLASHRTRRRFLWVTPAAVAAVVTWLVVMPSAAPEREAMRGGEAATRRDSATGLRIVAPTDNDTVAGTRVVFIWRAHPGEPLFRLTLSDASGRELWGTEGRDTTLSLPPGIPLDAGRTYFWRIDALDADGHSHTSRTQRFSTLP